MPPLWARIVENTVVEFIRAPKPGSPMKDAERHVNVAARPDIKVGSLWPFKTEQQAIADGDLAAPGVLPTKGKE